MSKRRDELRRGIRSLIRDTSRELADLEGREPPGEEPEVAAPEGTAVAPQEAAGGPGAAPAADPTAAPLRDGAGAETDGGFLHAEVVAVEVREISARPSAATESDLVQPTTPEGERGAEPRAASEKAAPAAEAPLPKFDGSEGEGSANAGDGAPPPPDAGAGVSEPEPAGAYPPASAAPARAEAPPPAGARAAASEQELAEADSPGGVEPAPAKARRPGRKRPARGTPKKAKGAHRQAAPAAADALEGVDPAQARSRKGVCVAYFVDHECWHVRNAYCNTALHVCVMRACPVYHLHKVALERRFASKYRHLW